MLTRRATTLLLLPALLGRLPIIVLVALLWLAPVSLAEESSSPTELMQAIEYDLRSTRRIVRMDAITDYGEATEQRTLWGIFDGNPDDTQVLYVFTSPDLIRGMSLLLRDRSNPAEDDLTWIYLPNWKNFHRLEAKNVHLLIPGLALSYEDSKGFIASDLYDFKWEDAPTRIEARPRTSRILGSLRYLALSIEVDSRRKLIMSIDYTALSGQPKKRYQVLEAVQLGDLWFPKRIRVTHLELNWTTEITSRYWRLEAPPDPSLYMPDISQIPFLPRLLSVLEAAGIPLGPVRGEATTATGMP